MVRLFSKLQSQSHCDGILQYDSYPLAALLAPKHTDALCQELALTPLGPAQG